MLVFDAILLNSKHVDAKCVIQCLVAESGQSGTQLVCHGQHSQPQRAVFTGAARKRAHLIRRSWDVHQKNSTCGACMAACCIRISTSHSSDRVGTRPLPRHLNSLVQWTWWQSPSPMAISFTNADCFGDKLLCHKSSWSSRVEHRLCF